MQPEVSHPTPCCPHPELWKCYDSEGTELEVLLFLTSLVVMLKPKIVFETGSYRGYGTEALALGVKSNGFGEVFTTDIGLDMVKITEVRLQQEGLRYLVTTRHGTGLQSIAAMERPIDLAFLDSGPDDVRCHELRAILPKMAPSGVIAIHDTGLQHGGRPFFFRTVSELGLQYFTFDTPRGLALVRKSWRSLEEEVK